MNPEIVVARKDFQIADTYAENVRLPYNQRVKVKDLLKRKLTNKGYQGKVKWLTAVASLEERIELYRELLESDEVVVNVVDSDEKNAADKRIFALMEVLLPGLTNPANIVMIVGDHYYVNIMKRVKDEGHNIIFIFPPNNTSKSML